MSTISDQFLNDYDTYKGDYSNTNLTFKAKECCDTNSSLSLDYCGESLYKKGENDENCKKVYKKFCETNLQSARSDKCTSFCSKKQNNCDTNRFKKFCSELSPYQFKKNSKLCGCFGSDQFYKNIRTKMSDKYNIPIELLTDNPRCFYPACKSSPFIHTTNTDCDTVNLSKCIQRVDFAGNKLDFDNIVFDLYGNCDTDINLNTDFLKTKKDGGEVLIIPGECDCVIDDKNLFYVFIGAGVLFLIFICIAVYMFLK